MVERSLSMREVRGSMPLSSIFHFVLLIRTFDFVFKVQYTNMEFLFAHPSISLLACLLACFPFTLKNFLLKRHYTETHRTDLT